ncbi:MAG: thioredoxin family protein [Bacteroidetes bacterium]|jgi:hypothetical protein|nr:thioredoxin family protein [Bacteroidota bacterium]
MLNPIYISNSHSYDVYYSLAGKMAEEGGTSGPDKTESLVGYTKLNFSRMKRLEKQEIDLDAAGIPRYRPAPLTLLAITETWCGDAAQNLPIINNIAKQTDYLSLRTIWRDEYPELMEQFLTNGSKSIPKVIVLDGKNSVLGTWGPRPQVLQELVAALKAKGAVDYKEISEEVQRWYNQDKGISLAMEFGHLLQTVL